MDTVGYPSGKGYSPVSGLRSLALARDSRIAYPSEWFQSEVHDTFRGVPLLSERGSKFGSELRM